MNRLAVAVWALVVVLVVASTAMSAGRDALSDLVLYGALPLNLATVGALVVSRAGGNRVGWLFLWLGLYVATTEAIEGYGLLAADTALSDGQVGAWTGTWVWIGEMAAWTILAAVFPDGRLSGRGWRWIPWGAAVAPCSPSREWPSAPGRTRSSHRRPTRTSSIIPSSRRRSRSGWPCWSPRWWAPRSRWSSGCAARGSVERQQLKWFVLAACVVAGVAPVVVALWNTVPGMPVVIAVAVNTIPVAAGIAILRYRLYDIDLVIKRTLVYTALTVVLLATYVVLVLVLQVVLSPVAGDSDLAVAASTLAVAALFRPLRSALQRGVDRRFFRSRYDAARTLDEFSGRLRHELDLDSLGTDLRTVVRETMQPATSRCG